MTTDLGVWDAEYTELLRRYLEGEVDAATFRGDFYSTLQGDGRVGDDHRYEILQRVFFACEDLVLDSELAEGEEREDDEIDENAFRTQICAAARDLAARDGSWEAAHGG